MLNALPLCETWCIDNVQELLTDCHMTFRQTVLWGKPWLRLSSGQKISQWDSEPVRQAVILGKATHSRITSVRRSIDNTPAARAIRSPALGSAALHRNTPAYSPSCNLTAHSKLPGSRSQHLSTSSLPSLNLRCGRSAIDPSGAHLGRHAQPSQQLIHSHRDPEHSKLPLGCCAAKDPPPPDDPIFCRPTRQSAALLRPAHSAFDQKHSEAQSRNGDRSVQRSDALTLGSHRPGSNGEPPHA